MSRNYIDYTTVSLQTMNSQNTSFISEMLPFFGLIRISPERDICFWYLWHPRCVFHLIYSRILIVLYIWPEQLQRTCSVWLPRSNEALYVATVNLTAICPDIPWNYEAGTSGGSKGDVIRGAD